MHVFLQNSFVKISYALQDFLKIKLSCIDLQDKLFQITNFDQNAHQTGDE